VSIASWMTQSVYIASAVLRDSYGAVTYETPRLIGARVESSRRMVVNSRGEEAVSQHRIYTLDVILLTDRVWLPGKDRTDIEESDVPLSVAFSSDRVGSKTLYTVDL
jgi:hypothetical protein